MRYSNKLILLTLPTIALILVGESRITILSKEVKEKMEKLLNHINKPRIKSFQTEHGYILDCIDIRKQQAFDHPLLKNHSIKLKPTRIPKWTKYNNTSHKPRSLPFGQDDIKCPVGTVIVKRITLEDLIQAQHLKSLRQVSSMNKKIDLTGHHFATVKYNDYHYGAKGNINTWNPYVSPDQFSLAAMTITEKLQSISAGWIVYPGLHQNQSSLFTYWTADGNKMTRCYNALCPGFVHVSTKYAIGVPAKPVSVYGGRQYHLEVSIYQDHVTGDWWFSLRDEPIGYWPRSLFKSEGLADGASAVVWGGEVYSSVKEKSPSMGSGHFPQEGFKKAAYVNGLKVITDITRVVSSPTASSLKTSANSPNCYNVKKILGVGEYWSRAILFGGPGGCTF
ncbi:hypothetical protein CARUB_v10007316mg [Capsella rubella]|uniref:Neprosin PEP catalytic domain-containing protein n=1 Tax=Capsella rubella TaxID=81985 RepID=R0GPC7_9BRAS|nr:uncharacterized protein LOC17880548 [Capsella rubella]EOA18734.1 hypothetical protein CARUB_v10007316mg [Capsella rubella]